MALCLFERYQVRLVNNSKQTIRSNLERNYFRDYRMVNSFNFFKTKFNQRLQRNLQAK